MIGWQSSKKGFTIVELLIVIVVIAILATITIVAYGAVQNNAHDAAIKTDLQQFADAVKLKGLDNQVLPPGGATNSLTGDSTVFPGMKVKPTRASYDLTGSNLFYCQGKIGGIDEFGFFAKSKSGTIFSYRSDQGVKTVSGNPAMAYTTCTTIGFSAPYTWSYGYNPLPQYQWFAWAS